MFQRPSVPWLVLPLAWLGACTDTDELAGPPGPTLTNAGLVTQRGELVGEDELWLVAAREFESGGRDLDGDGDAFDQVVFVTDLKRNRTTNSGFALSPTAGAFSLAVGGRHAAYAASELATGRGDLNGDGDTADDVVHVYDGGDGTTRGLALALAAGTRPVVEGGIVAFLVSEAAQGGRDIDGDGDATSTVLFVYQVAARTLVRTRIDVATELFVDAGRVAYLALEDGLDQNGDGDALDLVLRTFDPVTEIDASTGLASDGSALLAADGRWLVAVPEAAQGGLDANGDLDADDVILQVVDPLGGVIRSLGLFAPPEFRLASRATSGRDSFALLVPETDGVDRNLDGELDDLVAITYDPRAEVLASSQLAAAAPTFAGEVLGFLALEAAQGVDLNGDGDLADAVAHILNPGTGRVSNLRTDAVDLRGSQDFLMMARAERASAVDWNLDGDQDDVVVHAFSRQNGRTTNTAIASLDAFGSSTSELLLYVDEAGEGLDLNGDRDLADQVFVSFDVPRATSTSLGLAGSEGDGRFASVSRAGALVLLVDEQAQGVDLDGDGDRFDQVLHRGR
jgi:hypothetical protein